MKRVFSSPNSTEVGFLKNILQKAGIHCLEKNEQMAQIIPSSPFQAELWVENEADYTEASALMAEWLHPAQAPGMSWVCSRCGETLGSQFTKCWKCGTPNETRT